MEGSVGNPKPNPNPSPKRRKVEPRKYPIVCFTEGGRGPRAGHSSEKLVNLIEPTGPRALNLLMILAAELCLCILSFLPQWGSLFPLNWFTCQRNVLCPVKCPESELELELDYIYDPVALWCVCLHYAHSIYSRHIEYVRH